MKLKKREKTAAHSSGLFIYSNHILLTAAPFLSGMRYTRGNHPGNLFGRLLFSFLLPHKEHIEQRASVKI